jgi:2-polyprenyl-6-methoxyphenol hydroxylase-like FAD-dependent oxidoreductase
VHRGHLLIGLLTAVKKRLRNEAVVTDARLTQYKVSETGVAAEFTARDGRTHWVNDDLLIAADGIHSKARKQMHPSQGQPNWGGAVMWRGISEGLPTRTQNSFILMGSMKQRFVCYPISKPDPKTGLSKINWIAELTLPTHKSATQSDWNSAVEIEDFISPFNQWKFDWLDVPALIHGTYPVYESPMVDRDTVGSNGASQGIVGARVLGAKLQALGLTCCE